MSQALLSFSPLFFSLGLLNQFNKQCVPSALCFCCIQIGRSRPPSSLLSTVPPVRPPSQFCTKHPNHRTCKWYSYWSKNDWKTEALLSRAKRRLEGEQSKSGAGSWRMGVGERILSKAPTPRSFLPIVVEYSSKLQWLLEPSDWFARATAGKHNHWFRR